MNTQEIIKKLLIYSGLNASQFAKMVGAKTNQAIYDMQKGRTKTISPAMADKITSCFPNVNRMWLLTGEGEMLLGCAPPSPAPQHVIRYFPNVEVSLGGTEFLNNPDESSYDIIVPGFKDCQFAINAYGDSMLPLIHSGEIVVVSEWNENFIEWGEIYLVITRSGRRSIKRLMPSPDNPQCIECHSENNGSYPPFTVEKNDIAKLYRVKGSIKRFDI